MRNPARRSNNRDFAFDDDDRYPHELTPGERVGAPLVTSSGKAILRGLLIVSVFGGGWALLGDREATREWLRLQTAALWTWMDSNVRGPTGPATATVASAFRSANAEVGSRPAPASFSPAAELPPIPEKAVSDLARPPATAALTPPAGSSDDAPAQSVQPPMADPADPYQVRAEAVGLHPDLSRVLLTRLSPADYENAGIAIRTAMAEASDSAVVVWPRQRKPEFALFRVHFVAGAAPGCRRYIVTVSKDGWVTTALPMERCTSEARPARRG